MEFSSPPAVVGPGTADPLLGDIDAVAASVEVIRTELLER